MKGKKNKDLGVIPLKKLQCATSLLLILQVEDVVHSKKCWKSSQKWWLDTLTNNTAFKTYHPSYSMSALPYLK